MTLDEMIELFTEKHEDKYLSEVKGEVHNDLRGINLLAKLDPTCNRILGCAEHDIVYFGADADVVAENITEDQVIELIRCGICWDSEYDCFSKFV